MSAERYTDLPLPAYAYVPGKTPHPRRDPGGHAAGEPEPAAQHFDPERWHECEAFLYGVDLFNAGYFWECHEPFEALWRTAGRRSAAGRFLQALVWIAAAELQRRAGREAGALRLARRACERLAESGAGRLGIDAAELGRCVAARFAEDAAGADLEIRLAPARARYVSAP